MRDRGHGVMILARRDYYLCIVKLSNTNMYPLCILVPLVDLSLGEQG